jgi:Domain of unknown function (DUF4407)
MSTAKLYDPKESVDGYNYKYKEAGKFCQFLWFCAGADVQLLKLCPHSDRVKMEGLGGVVLATTVLACLSGFNAVSVIFHKNPFGSMTPLIAFGIAAIWAAMIFNLDRFIVTSTGHGDGTADITLREIKQSLPRLLLAIAIGLSLSAPLEITIMKPEIDAQLKLDQEAQYQQLVSISEKEYQETRATIERSKIDAEKIFQDAKLFYRSKVDAQSKQNLVYQEEMAGEGPNKTRGDGAGARAKKQIMDTLNAEFPKHEATFQAETAAFNSAIAKYNFDLNIITKKRDDGRLVSLENSNNLDGLSRRIQISERIAPSIHWALMFLLMALEVTPMLIKMMLIRGPYDLLTDNQKKIVAAKYAVQERPDSKGENSGKLEEQVEPLFHQAITIEKFEVGKLAVEASLAETAQKVFKTKTNKDIQENPDKYIKDDPSKA